MNMPTLSSAADYEDLHDCLRLAQLFANQDYDRQIEGKDWFNRYLQSLEEHGIELFERTTRSFSYVPTDTVMQDVFDGWIPAPQRRDLQFIRVASDILHALKQPDLALLRSKSSSSQLCIDFDVDDDDRPVAILFHLCCATDPGTPRTQLTLQLDHLGAKIAPQAFELRRKQVDAQLKALSALDKL